MGSGMFEQTAATRGIKHYPINQLTSPLPDEKEGDFPFIRPGTSITTPYSQLARESSEAPIQPSAIAQFGPVGAITVDLEGENSEALLFDVAEKISATVSQGAVSAHSVKFAVWELLLNAQQYGGSLDGVSRVARLLWNVEGDSPFVVVSNDKSSLFNPVKYLNRSIEEMLSDFDQCSTVNSHVFLQTLACSAKHLEFTWESPSRNEVVQCTIQKLCCNQEGEEEIPFRLVVACTKDGFPNPEFNLFQVLEENEVPPVYEKLSIAVAF
jgi:hypothetical protein